MRARHGKGLFGATPHYTPRVDGLPGVPRAWGWEGGLGSFSCACCPREFLCLPLTKLSVSVGSWAAGQAVYLTLRHIYISFQGLAGAPNGSGQRGVRPSCAGRGRETQTRTPRQGREAVHPAAAGIPQPPSMWLVDLGRPARDLQRLSNRGAPDTPKPSPKSASSLQTYGTRCPSPVSVAAVAISNEPVNVGLGRGVLMKKRTSCYKRSV